MASVISFANGTRMIQFSGFDGQRKYVRFGKITKRQAETAKLFMEDLVGCKLSGASPKSTTSEWVADLPKVVRRRLERAELIRPRARVKVPAFAEWGRTYIDGRTDVKAGTRINLEQAFKSAKAFFGDRLLSEITQGDAEAFRIHLN